MLRRVRDDGVELLVVLDQLLLRCRRRHPIEAAAKAGERGVADVTSRQGSGGRLEDPAHLDELEGEVVVQQVGSGTDAGEQELGAQARHVGAVAATNVEHACGDERTDRLADRAPARAQQLGQLGLRGQSLTRDELAVGDQVTHLLDGRLGQRCSHGRLTPRRTRLDIRCLATYVTACHDALMLSEPYRGARIR